MKENRAIWYPPLKLDSSMDTSLVSKLHDYVLIMVKKPSKIWDIFTPHPYTPNPSSCHSAPPPRQLSCYSEGGGVMIMKMWCRECKDVVLGVGE